MTIKADMIKHPEMANCVTTRILRSLDPLTDFVKLPFSTVMGLKAERAKAG